MIAEELRVKEVKMYIPTVNFFPLNETDHLYKDRWCGYPIHNKKHASDLVEQLNFELPEGESGIGLSTITRWVVVNESGTTITTRFNFYGEARRLHKSVVANHFPSVFRKTYFNSEEEAGEALDGLVKHMKAVLDNIPVTRRIGSSKWWKMTSRRGSIGQRKISEEPTGKESCRESKKIGSLRVGQD